MYKPSTSSLSNQEQITLASFVSLPLYKMGSHFSRGKKQNHKLYFLKEIYSQHKNNKRMVAINFRNISFLKRVVFLHCFSTVQSENDEPTAYLALGKECSISATDSATQMQYLFSRNSFKNVLLFSQNQVCKRRCTHTEVVFKKFTEMHILKTLHGFKNVCTKNNLSFILPFHKLSEVL